MAGADAAASAVGVGAGAGVVVADGEAAVAAAGTAEIAGTEATGAGNRATHFEKQESKQTGEPRKTGSPYFLDLRLCCPCSGNTIPTATEVQSNKVFFFSHLTPVLQFPPK